MKSVVEKYTIECKICFIDVDLYGLIGLLQSEVQQICLTSHTYIN